MRDANSRDLGLGVGTRDEKRDSTDGIEANNEKMKELVKQTWQVD